MMVYNGECASGEHTFPLSSGPRAHTILTLVVQEHELLFQLNTPYLKNILTNCIPNIPKYV